MKLSWKYGELASIWQSSVFRMNGITSSMNSSLRAFLNVLNVSVSIVSKPKPLIAMYLWELSPISSLKLFVCSTILNKSFSNIFFFLPFYQPCWPCECIIVIFGDIFNSKNKQIFIKFLYKLSLKMTIIVNKDVIKWNLTKD